LATTLTLLGFLDGLVGPGPAIGVVGDLAGPEQVHRQHGELEAGTTLQEEHGIVIAEAEQLLCIGNGFRMHGHVRLASVAVLHDGHASALEIEQFPLRFLKHLQRQRRRSRTEIVNPAHGCSSCPCGRFFMIKMIPDLNGFSKTYSNRKPAVNHLI